MRRLLSRSLCFSVPCFLLTLTFLANAPAMHGQLATNNGAVDLGPRPVGTVAAVVDCPVPNPVKFPPPSGVPNCVDISQPPSSSPNHPAAGAGNIVGFADPLTGLWFEAINVFEAVASVQGVSGVSTEPIVGLGPAFNSNSCFSCHEAPTVGGSSGGIVDINGTVFPPIPASFTENPELLAATDQGAGNSNPLFPTGSSFSGPGFPDVPTNGPSLEVRIIAGGGSGGFVVQQGSVAELFTIEGRSDAAGCTLGQFPFSSLGPKSIAFRIPTPTFGLGFVEATPDEALMANSPLGTTTANGVVKGVFNRSGNDGTITRFGWKAQNKSLMIFAGEASNVEMGVTNELFPNEKTFASGATCPTNTAPAGNQPEDEILPATFPANTGAANIASIISSNVQNNAVFMRLNAAPSQCDRLLSTVTNGVATCAPFGITSSGATVGSPSVVAGQELFDSAKLGCTECHSPTLVSGLSQNPDLSNQPFHPYSDFALHNMGANLSDGVNQGSATPPLFRTAPLWGAGQRLFFLHDGRASDLATAITQHCPTPAATNSGEACGSITVFNSLTKAQQQDILNFLRSL